MSSDHKEQVKTLSLLQGRKIVWAGFDPETLLITFLFDDRTGININGEVEAVADVGQFIDATLNENGFMAKKIVELETLYPKDEAAPTEAVSEPADTCPQRVVTMEEALSMPADVIAVGGEVPAV